MAKDYDKIAKSLGGVNYDSLATESGGAEDIGLRTGAEVRSRQGHQLASLLPAVGGMVGGIAGGIPGATIGGMTGKSLEMGLTGQAPKDLGEVVREVGGAGVQQGGSEIFGRAFGLPGKLLSPASKTVNRTLAARAEDVVRTADQAGIIVNATEAMDGALAPFMKRAQAAGKNVVDKLETFRENFLGNKAWFGPNAQGGTVQVMPASAAHEAKEYFDGVAKGIYKAQAAGTVTPGDQIVAQAAKKLADQLRAQLRKVVPGYTKVMLEESKNQGRRRALEVAARPLAYMGAAAAMHETPGLKNLPWWAKYGIVPAAAAGFARPSMVSTVADVATNPALNWWLQGTMANIPRAATVSEDTTEAR